MKLPGDEDRLFVTGKTGSGKTWAGAWHLSLRSFHRMPWIVYDFKGDKLLNSIPFVQHIEVTDTPKKPGLYMVHPIPETDDEAVEAQMWRIWEREKTGVYVDEGYMLNRRNRAYRALLTQGRSKHIPVITLTQRPVELPSRFIISEADYYQVFFLNDIDDIDRVQGFISGDLTERLPDYHSYFYDVASDEFLILKPTPGRDTILETFEDRLAPKRKFL